MTKSKDDIERELHKDSTSKEKESRAIDERAKKEMRGSFYKPKEKP